MKGRILSAGIGLIVGIGLMLLVDHAPAVWAWLKAPNHGTSNGVALMRFIVSVAGYVGIIYAAYYTGCREGYRNAMKEQGR